MRNNCLLSVIEFGIQLWSHFPKLTQSNSCHMSDLNSIIIYNPNVCVHSSGCQHSVDMPRILHHTPKKICNCFNAQTQSDNISPQCTFSWTE